MHKRKRIDIRVAVLHFAFRIIHRSAVHARRCTRLKTADVETELYYCNYRYYSPLLCSWISPDSLDYLDPETVGGPVGFIVGGAAGVLIGLGLEWLSEKIKEWLF